MALNREDNGMKVMKALFISTLVLVGLSGCGPAEPEVAEERGTVSQFEATCTAPPPDEFCTGPVTAIPDSCPDRESFDGYYCTMGSSNQGCKVYTCSGGSWGRIGDGYTSCSTWLSSNGC